MVLGKATTPDVGTELREVVSRFARTGEHTFEGAVCPGPSLVGPKGRLHGGLHPAVRLFAPLDALGVADGPVHVELGLRAALPLSTETPFTGSIARRAGGWRLETSFGTEGKLDAYADSGAASVDLDGFAREWRTCASLPEVQTILARGSVPTRVGQHTIALSMDDAFFALEKNEIRGYRRDDGSFGEAFSGVVLDLVGAIALAVTHVTHVFTTHLSLDFHVRHVPREARVVALASRARMHPDAESHLRPVAVRGALVPPMRVPVLLADAAMTTPFVSGVVTVLPVRDAPSPIPVG